MEDKDVGNNFERHPR